MLRQLQLCLSLPLLPLNRSLQLFPVPHLLPRPLHALLLIQLLSVDLLGRSVRGLHRHPAPLLLPFLLLPLAQRSTALSVASR